MKTATPGPFERIRKTSLCRLRMPLALCGATAFAAFATCQSLGVRLNTTGSLPIGLYRVSRATDANLVEFCPPEPFSEISVSRSYRTAGICPDGDNPLLKPIVARQGDIVQLSEFGIVVNGVLLRNTAPRPVDSKGRFLPHFPFGTYQVSAGTVWVASSYHPLSFDSRYFGPIPVGEIREHLKALLTQ